MYEEKVKKALSLAISVDDVIYIRFKVLRTDSINRRTNDGRELTAKLVDLCMRRQNILINEGAVPF